MKELRFLHLTYEENERKARAKDNANTYPGRDLEHHAAGLSVVLMDGSFLHTEVGESNFEQELAEGLYSTSANWGSKGLLRNSYIAQNEIKIGEFSGVQSFLKAENQEIPTDFCKHLKVRTRCMTLEDESQGDYNLRGREGSGTTTTAHARNGESEVSCGFTKQKMEHRGEWSSYDDGETRKFILDDMLMDVQTYSELPLHGNISETPQSGLDNVDGMICKSPSSVSDQQSLMRWFFEENYEVQTVNVEALSVPSSCEDMVSTQNDCEFITKTLEDPCVSGEAIGAHDFQTSSQMWGNPTAARCSLSSLPMLTNTTGSFSASVRLPGMEASKGTYPSYFYGNSSLPAHCSVTLPSSLPFASGSQAKNVQSDAAFLSNIRNAHPSIKSGIIETQVRASPFSGCGARALDSDNQTLLSFSAIRLNSSNPSLAQDKYMSQKTFVSDCPGELSYSVNRTFTDKHPFANLKVPSLEASTSPPALYPYRASSCHKMDDQNIMLPQSSLFQLPAARHHYLTGHHAGQTPQPRFIPFTTGKQFDQRLSESSRADATWQGNFRLEPVEAEQYSHTSEQYDHPQVRLSQALPIGSFDSNGRQLQSVDAFQQLDSAAKEWIDQNGGTNDGMMLLNQLLQVVEALDTGNPDGARSILARLKQYPLSRTQYIQRVTHFLRDQLSARLLDNHFPNLCPYPIRSPAEFLHKVSAHKSFCEASPFVNFAHFTANQAILDALEGEEIIHVIDFGINFGGQWASFLQDFALKPGKRRRLCITAVGCKEDEMYFAGERLCNFAKEHNIALEFQMVVSNPGNLTIEMLPVRDEDPVAVNFVLSLHKMLEDYPTSVDPLLTVIKGLSPRVVTVVDKELDDDSPQLKRRFFEALNYYSYLSDLLGAGNLENEVVMSIENLLLWPDLIDLAVYSNSLRRKEQSKSFQQWRHQLVSAGFQSVPLSKLAEMNAEFLIKESSAGEGYSLLKNKGSILLNWRGKTLLSASSWTC